MTYEKRGLYVDAEHLEAYAENFARSIRPDGSTSGRSAAAELRKTLRELSSACELLELKWAGIPAMPGAVRWLLENHYLAIREGRLAAAELERGEHLRFSSGGFVVLLACGALARSGLYTFSAERLSLFLRGFQRALILERGELSLLSAGLKSVMLRELLAVARAAVNEEEPAELEQEAASIFGSLRTLSAADLTETLEQADFVEQTLRTDPAGIYPVMDERSRSDYRRRVAQLAVQAGLPEHKAAQRALTLAKKSDGEKRHVGYWLINAPLGEPEKKRRGGLYITANALLTLFVSLVLGFAVKSAAAFFLLLVPVSELIKSGLDFLLLHTVSPAHLPRLALRGGVPEEGRTLCVISALLTSEQSGPALAHSMEEFKMCSRDAGPELHFAILADLKDAPQETLPEDAAILGAARSAVEALNEKYGGGFYLLTRRRTRNADGRWTGRERKRGALLETMHLLRGQDSGVTVAAGDADALSGTAFLLALDSDTRLSPGAARELIGTMLHPLCRPVIDEHRGVVTAGHAILVPRMAVTLPSAIRSDFSRSFAGQGGTDPYSGACSELYMDLWDRSGFTGKGLIHIDAYLRCLDGRIPENRTLSHDAVEGAFLRSGFVGDVELSDSFPANVLSYYRRAERWTRGDWQNLMWLFRPGRALPDLERFRLFDSLRRSLVPVMTLGALTAGFFLPGVGWAVSAAAALTALLSELLLTMAEAMFRSDRNRGERFQSALLVGVGGGLVRTFLRLVLLPAEAWVCLSAICRALWRQTVSKKHLLQWQTADQSDRAATGLLRFYRELWFPALLGILLAAFAPSVIGKAAGAIWLLSPLCALLLSLPAVRAPELKSADREYLKGCAADTWRYFSEHLTEADHYLPPDNDQLQPPVGVAHRTSPTNIGLALLSVLSAIDLGFTERESGLALMERCLETAESLPKWHGHLYNWYDTLTLQPLTPPYVSTVDSGNLCACLIALRAGFSELGRPDLSARAEKLAAEMDFAPLYDAGRRLFYIGLDPTSDTLPDSWYDLMASEARLTGFLAVARGDVPKEHWKKLSRAQLQYGRFRGMASWTGTMFEYLMPELLLPPQRDSLLWESAKFCVYVQQRRPGKGIPWGVSESAYSALDPAMNYRYKAHGCAHLALKRGMDDELVVSPYSSFLSLPVCPKRAVENLRRLETLGMRGPFGFWEALDFTASRTRPGKPAAVRCVMAHHAGMSMVAAANCLTGGSMQRRFLSDPAMSAHIGLLQEKVPVGGGVLRRADAGERRVKPPRAEAGRWEAGGSGTDFLHPECCLLASRVYSLLCTESGLCRPLWGGITPYVPPDSPLSAEKGADLFLDLGSAALPLLPDAYGDDTAEFNWSFSTDHASIAAAHGGLQHSVTVSLPETGIGEQRSIRFSCTGSEAVHGELIFRFRPLLARLEDYLSHPAFWGLGISARVRNGCLLLRRLRRGKTPELWMCLAPSAPCSYELSPGAVSGRTGGPAVFASDAEYFLTDPLVCAACALDLEPGSTAHLRFALAMAYSEDDALTSAADILNTADLADLPQMAASVIGMENAEIGEAFAMLPELCFPDPGGAVRQEALWRFGISGDLPIVCADYSENSQLAAARRLMDQHLFLTGCGRDFDLVFLSRDGASYHKPLQTALTDALWHAGGEVLMDSRGGVHIVEDSGDTDCIRAAAVLRIDLGAPAAAPARRTDWRAAFPTVQRRFPLQAPIKYDWPDNEKFMFYVNRSMPTRVWQMLLSNGSFGCIAADCGCGGMWRVNAREHQIVPWLCQPHMTVGPERLFLHSGGEDFSLFADPLRGSCTVSYLPGAAVWETRCGESAVRTTAFVPPDTDARVLLIECRGTAEDAFLGWQLDLLLSDKSANARFCRTAERDGLLIAENPRGAAEAGAFFAFAGDALLGFTCDGASALARNYDGKQGGSAAPVFAMKLRPAKRLVLVCGCGERSALQNLAAPGAAEAALERTRAYWNARTGVLSLRSPALALDRLMNGWCLYQTLACRLMGRCSIYQSGGAYGFRDQLQDAVNLLSADPAPAREQILRCCARQYAEGDVQHWWHDLGGQVRGIRTRCSDDLLWLPWALCEYAEKTGDLTLLREQTPYLVSLPLSAKEHDRYEVAQQTEKSESTAEHCARAIRCVMQRGIGPHGLLHIGSGDWNDGFDRVGGESVWLSWFFLSVSRRFGALCARFGMDTAELDRFAGALEAALDKAWDGEWYLRGWYADGSPLGSTRNAEGSIDSIAQSFSALCGGPAEKADLALDSAVAHLFDREHSLVKLFTPPFAGKEHPGYIEEYGPGFRENGGQYTHAALWLVMALLRRERTDEAWELLSALLPSEKDAAVYKVEPFVLSADVYAAPGHEGEGGWSWYTGAAGWFWRIVTEELLGLRLRGGELFIEPQLPGSWSGYSAVFRGKRIEVRREGITVDGVPYHGGAIPLGKITP